MGQIAEDILDGACCEQCGQYFATKEVDEDGEPKGIYCHGYPATCKECFNSLTRAEKKHVRVADVKTF